MTPIRILVLFPFAILGFASPVHAGRRGGASPRPVESSDPGPRAEDYFILAAAGVGLATLRAKIREHVNRPQPLQTLSLSDPMEEAGDAATPAPAGRVLTPIPQPRYPDLRTWPCPSCGAKREGRDAACPDCPWRPADAGTLP